MHTFILLFHLSLSLLFTHIISLSLFQSNVHNVSLFLCSFLVHPKTYFLFPSHYYYFLPLSLCSFMHSHFFSFLTTPTIIPSNTDPNKMVKQTLPEGQQHPKLKRKIRWTKHKLIWSCFLILTTTVNNQFKTCFGAIESPTSFIASFRFIIQPKS